MIPITDISSPTQMLPLIGIDDLKRPLYPDLRCLFVCYDCTLMKSYKLKSYDPSLDKTDDESK